MLSENKNQSSSQHQNQNNRNQYIIGLSEPSGNFGGNYSKPQPSVNVASITSPLPTASDPRYNDLSYICLRFKGRDFFCSKKALCNHSNHIQRLLFRLEYADAQASKQSQAVIELPETIKPDILIMLLDYIDRGKEMPNHIDMYIAQGVVQIAEALKMKAIERKFLMEIIMPGLNRENVVFFVKMAFEKLQADKLKMEDEQQDEVEENSQNEQLLSHASNQEIEEFWMEFFSYTLDLAAANIQYLLKKQQVEFHESLTSHIKEEILERAVRFYRTDMSFDNTLLFDALMKVRECSSIFQLLEQERMKIVFGEEQILRSGEQIRPTLTWKNQNLTGNFYRESDPFMVENAQWRLSISYFRAEEEALSVSIKMINNPFEVKKSKDYFKKKEFFLPSNIGMQNMVNPMDELGEDESQDEEAQQRRKQIEAANAEYPSHCFITIVSSVRIEQSQEMSESQVHTLICSAKSPALLKKFTDFRIEDYDGQVVVEIYFKIKYIFSAILLYISRNFSQLITDRYIFMLPKDQFKLLLKHKVLHVTQEDEVVKALCLWTENQPRTDNLENDLRELLENVNWNYVTMPCFLDLIRNFPIIRRHPSFQKIVTREFTMRSKFNPETTNLDPPRFSYKYNKTQQVMNLVSSIKNAKNAKCLLYVNHEGFLNNMIDAILEPSDIIQSHLVNDGMNESSHRKYLESQLERKKRELQDIEQQLQNMNILDDINNQRSYQESNLIYNNPSMSMASNAHNQRQINNGAQSMGQQQRLNGASDDGLQTIQNSVMRNLNVAQDGRQQVQQFNNVEEVKQSNTYEYQQQDQKKNVQVLLESVSYDYDDRPIGLQKGQATQELLSSHMQNSQQQQNQHPGYGSNSETLRMEHLQSVKPQMVDHDVQTDLTQDMIAQLLIVKPKENGSCQTGDDLISNEFTPRKAPVEKKEVSISADIQPEQMMNQYQQHFQLSEQQSQIENEDLTSNTMMGNDRDMSITGNNDFMAIPQMQSIQLQLEEGQEIIENEQEEIDDVDSQQYRSENQNYNNGSANANNSMTLKESRVYKNQQSSVDYQKQMKQFTQKVENLSKDIFDHQFLEQFISPQQQKAGMMNMEGNFKNNQQQTTTRGGLSTQPFTPSHMNFSVGGGPTPGGGLFTHSNNAQAMMHNNSNLVAGGNTSLNGGLNSSALIQSFYSAQQQQNPLRMVAKTTSNHNITNGTADADTSVNTAGNMKIPLYDILPQNTPIISKNLSTGIPNHSFANNNNSNGQYQQMHNSFHHQKSSVVHNSSAATGGGIKADPAANQQHYNSANHYIKDTKVYQKRVNNQKQYKMSLSPRTANVSKQIANNSQIVRANNNSKLGQSFGTDGQHLSNQQHSSHQSANKTKGNNAHHQTKQSYLNNGIQNTNHHNIGSSHEVSLRKNKSSGTSNINSSGAKASFNQSQVIQGGSLLSGQMMVASQVSIKGSRPSIQQVGNRQQVVIDSNIAHMSANSQQYNKNQQQLIEGVIGSMASNNMAGGGASDYDIPLAEVHSFNILDQLKQNSYAQLNIKSSNNNGEMGSNFQSNNLNSNKFEESKYQSKAPPQLQSVHSSIENNGSSSNINQSNYLNSTNNQPQLKSVTPSTNNNQYMLREERGDDEMQQQQSNSYASYSNKTLSNQQD